MIYIIHFQLKHLRSYSKLILYQLKLLSLSPSVLPRVSQRWAPKRTPQSASGLPRSLMMKRTRCRRHGQSGPSIPSVLSPWMYSWKYEKAQSFIWVNIESWMSSLVMYKCLCRFNTRCYRNAWLYLISCLSLKSNIDFLSPSIYKQQF